MHDPSVYSNPYEFKPERFLPASKGGLAEPDPVPIVFGFGRRVCPGMHLATASLWTFIACTLATFTVLPVKDKTGQLLLPVADRGPEIIRFGL